MSKVIIASRVEILRNPNHVPGLAQFHKQGPLTANLARDRGTFAILAHHDNGGIIQTAQGATLDLERMETRGEPFVYDCEGKLVLLVADCPLTRIEDSFRSNTRRTMNRLFEKIDRPSRQSVDIRLLPLMFWLDVAKKIMEAD